MRLPPSVYLTFAAACLLHINEHVSVLKRRDYVITLCHNNLMSFNLKESTELHLCKHLWLVPFCESTCITFAVAQRAWLSEAFRHQLPLGRAGVGARTQPC